MDTWRLESLARCSLSGPRSGPRSLPGSSSSVLAWLVFPAGLFCPVIRSLCAHPQQTVSVDFTVNIHIFLLASVASVCYLYFFCLLPKTDRNSFILKVFSVVQVSLFSTRTVYFLELIWESTSDSISTPVAETHTFIMLGNKSWTFAL